MPYKTYQQPASRKSGRKGASVESEENAEKEEVMDTNNVVADDDTEMEDDETTDGGKKKPAWLRTKEGGVKKMPKEVQRRRRNYRLKKLLTPKAPVMVLHELLGQTGITYEVAEPSQGPHKPGMFTASTVLDGKGFSGMGPSKAIAKNVCAESVLQHLVTKSCEGEADGKENTAKGNQMETDTPWVSLASLALFKMFNDWQAQGFQIPVEMMKDGAVHQLGLSTTKAAVQQQQQQQQQQHQQQQQQEQQQVKEEKPEPVNVKKPVKKTPNSPKEEKSLPENPQDKHPVQLLNEMMGPMEYIQVSPTGNTLPVAGTVFQMTVTVNGQTFSGEGRNKKDAKKVAAMAALKAIYNVVYPA